MSRESPNSKVPDEVRRVLPRGQLVVIPQAGHGSPRQNPQAFLAAVFDFLRASERVE